MRRRRSPYRWHVWSTLEGELTVPEPVSSELWRAIRRREVRESADGCWREVLDEEGRPVLVLVRYAAPPASYRGERL
jgi:hypothetical protein